MSVSDCAFCGRSMLEPGRADYPVIEVGVHELCFDVAPRLVAAARLVVDAWEEATYLEDFNGAGTIPTLREALEMMG